MKESASLINQAIAGKRPARTPIFDLFSNDAIVSHFAGKTLDGTDDEATMLKALGAGVDGTRLILPPRKVGETWTDWQGNEWEAARWTSWIRKHAITDMDGWTAWIRQYIENHENSTSTPPDKEKLIESQQAYNSRLNGTVFLHCTPSTTLNTAMFGLNCTLDQLSLLWMDERDLILKWFDVLQEQQIGYIRDYAWPEASPLSMIYSDIAFKNRLMFGKSTFKQMNFFDHLERLCSALHEKGIKAIFHSDGYVMDIMDDLVAAGIDAFNPIEKAAGMDIYLLRKKYPELILVGGVDVSNLLPFGTPEEVRTETRKIINECGSEGRLLIGTTTELGDDVPAENYLAFWNEVMEG